MKIMKNCIIPDFKLFQYVYRLTKSKIQNDDINLFYDVYYKFCDAVNINKKKRIANNRRRRSYLSKSVIRKNFSFDEALESFKSSYGEEMTKVILKILDKKLKFIELVEQSSIEFLHTRTKPTMRFKENSINETPIVIKDEPIQDVGYYDITPNNAEEVCHVWKDDWKIPINNQRVHDEIDLNSTQQIFNGESAYQNVNPFDTALTNHFLEKITFTKYAGEWSTCQLQQDISPLEVAITLNVHEDKFKVLEAIVNGGHIFKGERIQNGNHVVLKQSSNCWEYYICSEIESRIKVQEMLSAYMRVDWAIIGKNTSLLISPFAQHGSLLHVCNKILWQTKKPMDEYVVMHIARELLEIVDHLHAVNIIHAEIQPDNLLLVNMLTYRNEVRSLQLIDFSTSIDMNLFQNPRQTFTFVHKQNAFNCVEMREGRPWTYQIDLNGLAGVIHVLLFGKYMEITKRDNKLWMPSTHIPHTYQQSLWKNIFKTLLNVKDCFSMPDLQALRRDLKEILVDQKQHAVQKLSEFNALMRS